MFSILAARNYKGSLLGTVMDIQEMVITVIFHNDFFLNYTRHDAVVGKKSVSCHLMFLGWQGK